MREIKFRAWDILDNRFAISDNLIITNDGFFRGFTAFENNETSTRLILEQYTGLKDKNGREIYEGDLILQPEFVDRGDSQYDDCVFQVQWNSDAACFVFIDVKDKYNQYCIYDLDHISIIGNIHENPELL
jgi:uncharacterized phage protein (TIGR01671 family)